MAPSKAAAVSAAVLEAPARSAWAGVVVAELLEQLRFAAPDAARASLDLRFGGITRGVACSSAQKDTPLFTCLATAGLLSSSVSSSRVSAAAPPLLRSSGGAPEVRAEGVEPPRAEAPRLLRPARLPVPPRPQGSRRLVLQNCGSSFKPQAVSAAAAVAVRLRGAACAAPRAGRPWPDGAPSAVSRRTDAVASTCSSLIGGCPRHPPLSEGAAGEVGDELRRRGVEADDVEHPRVVRVGDREAV
jgi:hypothetical protein